MLDSSDKKWIEKTIDERLDTRFAEQDKRLEETMNRRFTEQDKRFEEMIDRRFAEQNDQLNQVFDKRFEDALKSFEQRIDERFDAFETRFMLMMENEIAPMLRIHAEVIPDTYKSYRNLEERVEALELNYDVLKNALSSRF